MSPLYCNYQKHLIYILEQGHLWQFFFDYYNYNLVLSNDEKNLININILLYCDNFTSKLHINVETTNTVAYFLKKIFV